MAKRCRSCCAPATVAKPFHVIGCNNLDLAGATVSATQGGVVVASGTTNSVGSVTITTPAAFTTYTISKARFDPFSFSAFATTSLFFRTLAPTVGYHCQATFSTGRGCADPLNDTLFYNLAGSIKTLTYTLGSNDWRAYETRGGVYYLYSTQGAGIGYVYCSGPPSTCCSGGTDTPCVPPGAWPGPTTTTNNAFRCPPAGFLIDADITSPFDSGNIQVTE
jgi:hypothetical protein